LIKPGGVIPIAAAINPRKKGNSNVIFNYKSQNAVPVYQLKTILF